jgi:hypothetical protein
MQLFYVIEGAVTVKVHRTSFVMAVGGQFMVPRGMSFSPPPPPSPSPPILPLHSTGPNPTRILFHFPIPHQATNTPSTPSLNDPPSSSSPKPDGWPQTRTTSSPRCPLGRNRRSSGEAGPSLASLPIPLRPLPLCAHIPLHAPFTPTYHLA